ncbi:MAG TPA: zinc ribbon domain-containing protein, partial [Thermoplasmata archaeon]|nr:zinc ribbon domain-containing protein [Thermoplasmata archaeon]
MEELACPKCGFVNIAGARFCTSCGRPIAELPATVALPPAEVRPPFTGLAQPYLTQYHVATARQAENTKTGILLLLVGALLGWIPLISLVGGILSLIGAIMVILGRKAFGRVHTRNVMISVALFVGGIIGIVVLVIIQVLALVPTLAGGTPDPIAIRSAFTTYFYGIAVITAVSSLASVLFTYDLQR